MHHFCMGLTTAVVYAEAGGTCKTTITSNLAVAFERMGLRTLMVDLDSQKANLTSLLGVEANREDQNQDNLVRHILGQPGGSFADLIRSTEEGPDLIPSHNMMSAFQSHLESKIDHEVPLTYETREEFPRYQLMNRLFKEQASFLDTHYDVVLVDPNARAEDLLYNAIYAMGNLIAPIEPDGKGSLSLQGLSEMVSRIQGLLGKDLNVLCGVPVGVGQTTTQRSYTEHLREDVNLRIPVTINERKSMMKEMWDANGSAFKVVEEQWKAPSGENAMQSQPETRRVRDREVRTLEKFYELAATIAALHEQSIDPRLTLDFAANGTHSYDLRTDSDIQAINTITQ